MDVNKLLSWINSLQSPECKLFKLSDNLSDGKVENSIVEELTTSETVNFKRWTSTIEQRAHNFTLIFQHIKEKSTFFPLSFFPLNLTAENACMQLAMV